VGVPAAERDVAGQPAEKGDTSPDDQYQPEEDDDPADDDEELAGIGQG
jgi:hypothetical protein